MLSGKHKYIFTLFAFTVITASRLIVTADQDILALNAPYDEYWFVNSAYRFIWGGPYNHLSFAHLPVYSFWLLFNYLFGIPARFAIEIAWILSSLYLSYSVSKLTDRLWTGSVIFFLLIVHPYTFSLFNRALAETLLLVLTTFLSGAYIEIWNCRGNISSLRRKLAIAILVIGSALAYHTRKEGLLLLIPNIILALLFLCHSPKPFAKRIFQTEVVTFTILPLASIVFFGVLVASLNYLKWGVFCRYELAAPGYRRAIKTLNAIDSGTTPKHVTITKKTRLTAYEVSPTFKELEPYFEGPPGEWLSEFSSQYTGVPGEIGNGWFYWAFRDAAASVGWHKDAAHAEKKYNAVADELEYAFDQQNLNKRSSYFSFLDPDIPKWINNVPEPFKSIAITVAFPDKRTFYAVNKKCT